MCFLIKFEIQNIQKKTRRIEKKFLSKILSNFWELSLKVTESCRDFPRASINMSEKASEDFELISANVKNIYTEIAVIKSPVSRR